ncbi:VOC family protein [Cellulomonas fengjieae]|uniref:VOC family protein n=1 Tax=Cellulomonas fengjieae TaxID=2819978 RepID=UPI001FBB3B4B|nr:VOC family protein [Cellulomonas fengjieae]
MPDDELDDGAYLADPAGVLPSLSFLQVPEGKVSKNRVHLDVQVSSSGRRHRVSASTR